MKFNSKAVEQYIVGCMIQDEMCSNRCLEISNKYFQDVKVREIYEKIVEIVNENKVVDLAEVAMKGVDTELLNQCFLDAATTTSFEEKFELLKAIYNKNNLISQVASLYNELNEGHFNTTQELNERLVDALKVEQPKDNKAKKISEIYDDLQDEYEFFETQKPMLYGINELDKYTHGIYNSELTVIAARPGKGKTALAVQIALNLDDQNLKGVIFSREMGQTQIIRRVIANKLKINSYKLKRLKHMTDYDKQNMEKNEDEIRNIDLRIDTTCETVEKIMMMCKYYKNIGELDFIIIDYLQLLETSKKCQSREQEVAYISRQLKLLTLNLKIPVILLSQLNRGPEQRQEKRPVLSDLRESGAIEQDANNVFMLYQDKHMEEEKKLDIMIVKQREGVTRDITVKYYKGTNTIEDLYNTCPF